MARYKGKWDLISKSIFLIYDLDSKVPTSQIAEIHYNNKDEVWRTYPCIKHGIPYVKRREHPTLIQALAQFPDIELTDEESPDE